MSQRISKSRIGPWLRHVFTVMGGFIAGMGVMVMFVAAHALTRALPGTVTALACAGLAVATMSWINFRLDSDFKWLLLVPVLAWLLRLATYALARSSSSRA